MRVLITGASGFIGSHLARQLGGKGDAVLATGRDRAKLAALADTPCELRTADLATDDLGVLVEGCDAIVHCGGRAAPWGRLEAFWADNVIGTGRLVAAAQRTRSVRRFVFISSPSIYFRARDQFDISETFTAPSRWPTAYAESKWIAERRVLAVPEVGPIVLRPRAVFGPRDTAIVPRLIAVARSGRLPLPGGGRALTDVTYVDNVVHAIECALRVGRDMEGRAFNVTNGEPIQVRALLERLMRSLELPVRFVTLPRGLLYALARTSERVMQWLGAGQEPRLTAYGVGLLGYSQTLSIQAAQRDLGYRPLVSVADGLERYAAWWKAQT